MRIEPNEICAILSDEYQATSLIKVNLETVLPQDRLSQVPPDERFVREEMTKRAKQEWLTNLSIVFRYAKYPIEKIFLNQLIYNAIATGLPRLIFTLPSPSATSMMERYRNDQKVVDQMWEKFLEDIGEDDPDAETEHFFLECIRKSNISQQAKDNIIFQYTEGSVLFDYLHLTIQSTFDDLKYHGKVICPDILIWVPAEPKIKLFVDCDGFIYHSNTDSKSLDDEKEHFLTSNGFRVLRFSCREIVNDPVRTAEELRKYLITELQPYARRWIYF